MDLQLQGLRAVVTGASKGIGAVIASVLAREGADLVLVSRRLPELEQLADSLRTTHRVQVEAIAADLSTPEGRLQVAESIHSADILVNNAGAIPPGSLLEVTEDAWRRAWDLKVYGYVFLTQALYPMIAKSEHGVILNIIGVASEDLPSGYIVGAMGNTSLVGFTKTLAKAAWRDGVRVVGINPGPTATDRHTMLLRARALEQLGDAERWKELDDALPFGRASSPEEIANATAFLVSPLSGYTSGTVLTIDGGKA